MMYKKNFELVKECFSHPNFVDEYNKRVNRGLLAWEKKL